MTSEEDQQAGYRWDVDNEFNDSKAKDDAISWPSKRPTAKAHGKKQVAKSGHAEAEEEQANVINKEEARNEENDTHSSASQRGNVVGAQTITAYSAAPVGCA